ncbi:MAG: VOC family protein [Bifidobacterium psychraerophilum]|uniref:VOC family protein n=1 Tax=Bifidobacterium psychraerophilum TaxID=218140 RepID=UPI0039E7A83B
MIDHITLHVSDVGRSLEFFTRLLAPLGYIPKVRHGETVGFGANDGTPRSDFYLSPRPASVEPSPQAAAPEQPSPVTHIAFRADDESSVRRFHQAGIAAGGKDNGEAGPRDYHPGYYAAFIVDPDGNNIEAVVDWSHHATLPAAPPRDS